MVANAPKLLVVADRDDGQALADVLQSAGFTEPAIGAGSDETLDLYQRIEPDVVVLCAGLERGDARALVSAMRDGPRGSRVKIILVGEERGPIRNALDAADFDVDRFVGRPVSPKALAFAVRQCAQAVGANGPALEEVEEAHVAELNEVAEEEVTAARADFVARLEVETDRAIESFVRDAIGALSSDFFPDTLSDSIPDPAPPVPPREPTLILSGHELSGAGVPEAVAAPEYTEPVPEDPDAGYGESRVFSSMEEELGDPLADLDDLPDLVDDLDPGASSAQVTGPVMGGLGRSTAADAVGGGSFARELRRKMSAMAQRLFPEQATGPGSPVDLGLAHDAHTEIDLAALGLDATGVVEPVHQEISSADTFADTNPLARMNASGSSPALDTDEVTGPRAAGGSAPVGGQLGEGEDVASLLARLFGGKFTGRVEFRRPPAEKHIYLEEGRPVFASSNLPHDRMGDLLFREGKITREQHAHSRDLVVESGRRMGEVLVEMGFLKPRELLPAVRRHIEDIIYSLFSWTSGEFSTAPGEQSGERIRLSRHPAALVLEGVRRKYGFEALDERLGSPQAILQARTQKELSSTIGVTDLSDAERAVIESLDGERSIEEAAEEAGLDLLNAMQLGFGLVALGVAEVLHRGDETVTQPDAGRAPALVGETDIAIDRQRVLAKYALVHEADYFVLLGVRRDATAFEIKRAYESARRDYAGEVFPAEVRRELADEIETIGDLIDEAYLVLRDDDLRQSYLSNLRD